MSVVFVEHGVAHVVVRVVRVVVVVVVVVVVAVAAIAIADAAVASANSAVRPRAGGCVESSVVHKLRIQNRDAAVEGIVVKNHTQGAAHLQVGVASGAIVCKAASLDLHRGLGGQS